MEEFTCPRCGKTMDAAAFGSNLKVCIYCNYHGRLSWQERLALIADSGSFAEFDAGMTSKNPIDYPGYPEKIASLGEQCGMKEAVVTGRCAIGGAGAVISIMDSRFMMASMGSVVGEKITRAFEHGAERGLPVIVFSASGGARMQEGIFSLIQMAKTSGAVGRLGNAGQLYITVLTDPTTGGVTASFAMLGDIIISEPGALVGFAGKRVIQATIGAELPPDFQKAEFVHQHGFVDMIVPREKMKETLTRLLRLHGYGRNVA
jgi:acetyl-CoA carboxylase carboxyl transferase subunit beta